MALPFPLHNISPLFLPSLVGLISYPSAPLHPPFPSSFLLWKLLLPHPSPQFSPLPCDLVHTLSYPTFFFLEGSSIPPHSPFTHSSYFVNSSLSPPSQPNLHPPPFFSTLLDDPQELKFLGGSVLPFTTFLTSLTNLPFAPPPLHFSPYCISSSKTPSLLSLPPSQPIFQLVSPLETHLPPPPIFVYIKSIRYARPAPVSFPILISQG
jgi:hypothetical protein